MTAAPYRAPGPEVLAWVLGRCGAIAVEHVERLVGGITADVDRLVLGRRSGPSLRVVLRRWGTSSGDAGTLVEREAAALAALAPTAVPAPALVAADPTGAEAGVRCLLMTELPGAAQLAPDDTDDWLRRLAQTQALVHRTPLALDATTPGRFDPDRSYAWITDPGVRRAALDAAAAADGDRVLAHGDFQPFNVLWRDGAPSGVVDWPHAGTGPRAVDVGHCLLNVAVLRDADAAQSFRRHYERAAGVGLDPGGLVRALLGWDPGWQRFIPVQVAGRAPVDVEGMPARVAATIRRTLDSASPDGV
ncbi:aminoglycoside phosphotransferase family protein [Jatrophihabitans endophyticus]|uniref:aminoglycoside phosphotransferase family protein n=1 Tax=Jatrophihabitans endophyticus TaxID=1206085 RepID=UPI0019EDFBEE|nr:aminoglycoside phosphotransferase family protein [Jatrophihabitans endophyticus]MBE7187917.1 aminoglycoside phosphotransferase family protein [Jatrophihabitans endophyticus]